MWRAEYHGDISFVLEFAEAFQWGKIETFEAPDLHIKYSGIILIVEHFQFDCFKSIKKGSIYKIEESKIKRLVKRIVSIEEGVHFQNV